VQVRLDGHLGAMALAAAIRVPRRSGVVHPCQFSSGASGGAHLVATEDEVPRDRSSSGEAAEKLVDLELDALAQDDLQSALPA
jgi:hypothetical protein